MIRYSVMNEFEKEIIASWKYEGEYAMYNLPSYKEQKEKSMALANPKRTKNYYVYYDENTLLGFTNILEEEKEVFMGIGVNPNLCGKGYGKHILLVACGIAQDLYPNKPLYLEVRTWNERAIRCYEFAGFKIDGEAFEQSISIGKGEFYRMIKK